MCSEMLLIMEGKKDKFSGPVVNFARYEFFKNVDDKTIILSASLASKLNQVLPLFRNPDASVKPSVFRQDAAHRFASVEMEINSEVLGLWISNEEPYLVFEKQGETRAAKRPVEEKPRPAKKQQFDKKSFWEQMRAKAKLN